MGNLTEAIVTIGVAITGVAIIAVIVSRNSNTAAVLQAGGSAFTNVLATAVSPVTGRPANINSSYPTSGSSLAAFTPSMINN